MMPSPYTTLSPALDVQLFGLRWVPACFNEEDAMPNQLGPVEINCDAPAYPFVQACRQVGIQNPEDVRWCRISHLISEQPSCRNPHPCLWVLGRAAGAESSDAKCFCGQCLPPLEKFIFFLSSGVEKPYFLGQCSRCHTVFWDES
jgi:hypothetical protein